jgi:hypothetical protein
MPPSTTNAASVTYEDSSLAKNSTAQDTSVGSAMRPGGTAALTAGWVAGSSVRAIIGVKTAPVHPVHPDPRTANLAAADEMLMIDPLAPPLCPVSPRASH